MPSKLVLTYRDAGTTKAEKSTFQASGVTLTSGNIAAQLTLQATLTTAIAAVVIGELQQIVRVVDTEFISNQPAADPSAQREQKWMIVYEDMTTHKLYRSEIPCCDTSMIDPATEELEAGAERTALISAFEAYVLSEDGNAVEVRNIRYVSRNT